MISNLVNTVLGIVLVYLAVLRPELVEADQGAWLSLVAGVVVIVLALVARRSDPGKWFSTTNAVTGIALIGLGVVQAMSLAPALLSFWGVFWSGCIVAVIALWAALYSPEEQGSTRA